MPCFTELLDRHRRSADSGTNITQVLYFFHRFGTGQLDTGESFLKISCLNNIVESINRY